jgi:hypothetical protein
VCPSLALRQLPAYNARDNIAAWLNAKYVIGDFNLTRIRVR